MTTENIIEFIHATFNLILFYVIKCVPTYLYNFIFSFYYYIYYIILHLF